MTPVPAKDRYRQAALLHVANLEQGFLSTLGPRFLAQMYRAIDESDGSVLLTAERDGAIVGFVSGGSGLGPIYRRMLRRPFRLAWALLPSLVRPARLLRILEILRYGKKTGERSSVALPDAELLSIAVDPAHRGRQVADELYAGLVREFARLGVAEFRITVGEALAPAHRFYRRMGAVPVATLQVHAGQSSTVYVHRLGADT